jgi:hypothetical protein
MSMITTGMLADIPYLDHATVPGRFLSCLNFYDEDNRLLSGETLHILKPHGSVNWLYCDACRETFWVPPSDTEMVAQTLFRRQDWAALPAPKTAKMPAIRSPGCPHCKTKSLGTRFATFSYRKALDFPMHSASWRTAEQYLKGTADWVFIGYRCPRPTSSSNIS